jgi:hypothetical protein
MCAAAARVSVVGSPSTRGRRWSPGPQLHQFPRQRPSHGTGASRAPGKGGGLGLRQAGQDLTADATGEQVGIVEQIDRGQR